MRTNLRRLLLVVSSAVVLVCAAPVCADAAQVALAWDPNTEADIAGYIVEWDTPASPFTNSVDVGNTTTWTLAAAADGVTYSFRVVAYNTAGERSDPSSTVSSTSSSTAPDGPVLSLERSSLNFGVVRSGTSVVHQTGAQQVRLTQTGSGTMTWSVSASAAWVLVSPASGSGTEMLTVSVNPAAAPAAGDANAVLTVSSPESSNGPQSIAVHLRQMSTGTSAPPIGWFDTPADDATGIAGAVPVTGWALDDVAVDRVELWRDPVNGEPTAANGKVFIGNPVFVAGARPDVEAIAPDTPFNYRAGWGYLLLTNVMPDAAAGSRFGGNGTFTLYAYAIDAEDHESFLGSKRITLSNAGAVKPFGTIDTPDQGETIGGSDYVSFGWALSPTSTIPTDGSTIDVYIDGVDMGHPIYNQPRSDIQAAFPGYANTDGAVGFLRFDTTKLSNGVHTIGWLATDAAGNTDGLGSRFFTVFNSGSALMAQPSAARPASESVAALPVANEIIEVRRAFTPDKAASFVVPEYSGTVMVQATELEQIEVHLDRFALAGPGTYEGYLVVGGALRPLPGGSTLDAAGGVFLWQPGAGFVGRYDFVFVRTDGAGNKAKVPVRVQIAPKFDAGGG